ncbi:MAG: fumarylacetoacetate hydrolase family protein [Flavobacteriales bacterium]|jgi:acylpyruvate hydrolase
MKIICIGRNYAEHAKELGNALPTEPVFFCKPDSALLPKGNPFYIPDWTNDVHYEVELVLRIDRLGKHITEEFAPRYFGSVGLGIDFTARDVQEELKKKGLPWEKAKGFDGAAVISQEFVSIDELPKEQIQFTLAKNGDVVQSGSSADMIFNFNQIVSYVSRFMTLKIGDLIFTGTPSGVGKVNPGDVLTGNLEGRPMFQVKVK